MGEEKPLKEVGGRQFGSSISVEIENSTFSTPNRNSQPSEDLEWDTCLSRAGPWS